MAFTTRPSMRYSDEDPITVRVNLISRPISASLLDSEPSESFPLASPSSPSCLYEYVKLTLALFDTGCPIGAPCISSYINKTNLDQVYQYIDFKITLSFLTLIFLVDSPSTKLIASMRFDLPDPLGPMIAVNGLNGPILTAPL